MLFVGIVEYYKATKNQDILNEYELNILGSIKAWLHYWNLPCNYGI